MTSPRTVIGIQGGPGSFNDSAVRSYLKQHSSLDADVVYLDTTPRVLSSLSEGKIDLGQFAIYNKLAGFYRESLQALGTHRFTVTADYPLRVSHSLMIRRDGSIGSLHRIITHSEVLKQCRQNLSRRYPRVGVEIGSGRLTDPARVAEALAAGELPADVGVVSNKLMAEIHGLSVVEEGLEDDSDNESIFLLVGPLQD